MHVARLKHPGPATEETWVTDGAGDPLLVVMAEPSDSLAAQIRALLPDLRGICGNGSKPLLCFDRGGWSPDLFAHVIAAGFDLLTYRKEQPGKPVPDIGDGKFTTTAHAGDDGRQRSYDLADTRIDAAGHHRRAQGRGAGPAAGHPPRQGPPDPHPHHPRHRPAARRRRRLRDDRPVAGRELLPVRPRPLRPRRPRLLRRRPRRPAAG